MNLMESRIQKILQENRADFIDSLRLSGIDVKRGGWSADAVEQNAQAGALSLIQFASQESISDRCRDIFLWTIAEIWTRKNAPPSWLGFILLTNGPDDSRPMRSFNTWSIRRFFMNSAFPYKNICICISKAISRVL